MRLFGRIAMTGTLTHATKIHAKENAHQQEKKAADNPGPVRNIHFKPIFLQKTTPRRCEALHRFKCLLSGMKHQVPYIQRPRHRMLLSEGASTAQRRDPP